MGGKTLIFTGAPEGSALDWSPGQLLSEFQDVVAQFAGIKPSSRSTPATASMPDHAAWRLLPMCKEDIHTGFSQQWACTPNFEPDESRSDRSPDFLTTTSLSFASDGEHGEHGEHSLALSQFYEHSVAAYQELHSSQLVPQSSLQATSFLSDAASVISDDGTRAEPVKGPLLFRGSEALSDLKQIPPAGYLLGIQPQTMTCNFIVGIISISQQRAVRTRWGATKYLVELLVGDETRAGFAVTYWLPSDSVAESPLAGLRSRDVVLLRNVALNVFKNKVYGSSLRKDLTRVHLLYRSQLDAQDDGGYYNARDLSTARDAHPQLEKTRRVRDWVLDFVGAGGHARSRSKPKPRWDMPPADDTQLT